jgi:uncharacterized protein YbaP (TraB family)
MNKTNILCCILFLCLQLQTSNAQQQNTRLWVLKKSGFTDSYIYLTGPACGTAITVTPELQRVIAQVKTIAVEVDLYSPEARKIAAYNYANEEKDKIKNNLSNADFSKLFNILKEHGYPDNAINTLFVYRIPVAYIILSSALNNCGNSGQTVYETEFKKLATKNKLKYHVLCSVDSVIAQMNIHTNNYWVTNINAVVNAPDAFKEALRQESELYKADNFISLATLYKQNEFFIKRFNDNFLLMHSRLLSKSILEEAKEGPVLFTIDITNIITSNSGLFDMLEKNGFEVKPAF